MPAPVEIVVDRPLGPPPKLTVDRAKCVVHGLRFVGPRSKNGWKYPERALRPAVGMFDGLGMNVGHFFDPVTRRPIAAPVEAKFARAFGPEWTADGINGSAQCNPEHPFTPRFLWACENDPSFYGMSQHALVERLPALDADGDRVADRYLAVFSLDVVAQGAATNSLLDSLTPGAGPVAIDVAAIAAQIADQGSLEDFLTSLLDTLSGIDPTAKATVLEHLLAAATGTAAPADLPADGSQDGAVADSLRRFKTPHLRRAAILVDALLTDREQAKRHQWAAELIARENLPADLRTDVFVDTVADSYGNETRAKLLIADRKRLVPAGGGGGTADVVADSRRTPRTTTPAPKKTIADIAASYAKGE